MKSLESVAIMPIPHWNSMSFVGMGSKNEYLIWKDSIDGFFTALRKNGELITWSSVTGKLLWEEPQIGEFSRENLKEYTIYRSDKDDSTYLGNYYNYNDTNKPGGSYSISLLVSKRPVKTDIKNPSQNIMDERDRQDGAEHIDFDTEFHKQKDDAMNMFTVNKLGKSGKKQQSSRKFKSSLIKDKLYHFKVVQLRQFEDIKRDEEMKKVGQTNKKGQENKMIIKSECKLLYHFFHTLLHPFKNEDGSQYFDNSDWYLNY